MKKMILVLGVVLVALQLKAQFDYDEWGNVLPFSLTEKYKAEIESYDLPSYIIPKMDNDSLCKRYNNGKSIDELKNHFIDGFVLRHLPISVKEKGICITLEHGKLWRYAIEGTSACSIGINLGYPKLKGGTYVAIIADDTTVTLIQPPRVYNSKNLFKRHKKRGLMGSVYGKKLIIEYFEPNSLKDKEDIIIKNITYGFVGFGNPIKSFNNESELKSGYWAWATI